MASGDVVFKAAALGAGELAICGTPDIFLLSPIDGNQFIGWIGTSVLEGQFRVSSFKFREAERNSRFLPFAALMVGMTNANVGRTSGFFAALRMTLL